MFGWLKKLLGWRRRINLELRCRVLTKNGYAIQTFIIGSAFGMKLYGVPIDNPADCRLIGQGEAVDRDHFWDLWEHFSGDGWKWEDGTPVRPRELMQ